MHKTQGVQFLIFLFILGFGILGISVNLVFLKEKELQISSQCMRCLKC